MTTEKLTKVTYGGLEYCGIHVSQLQVGHIYLNNHEHRTDYQYSPCTLIYLGEEDTFFDDIYDHTIKRETKVYMFYEVETNITCREYPDEEGYIAFLPRINL